LGYEPNELPDCSTPHFDHKQCLQHRQTSDPTTPLDSEVRDTFRRAHGMSIFFG
jgi:hypothetical protein